MVTIWIELLRHADGRARYGDRGQLYRTRLDGPHGEVLCQQTVLPVCPSCRALLARGISGPFETWREGIPYACMRGDIEITAGLIVKEPDRGAIAFARWNAFPSSPVEARTRKDDETCGAEPAEAIARVRSVRSVLPEAAE